MRVSKGDKLVVVGGVKIPKGTTGTAFWVGETKYGMRVGFKDASGATLWTALGNVEVADAPAPAVAAPVTSGPSLEAKVEALLALTNVLAKGMMALETKVAALEAAAVPVPAPPAPFIPDGVDPAEVAAFTH